MPKRQLDIRTADGSAKADLFGNAGSGSPCIILYMDAFGPRPALDAMAERLASEGYVVLVPDLFYRNAPYGPFNAKTAFTVDDTRARLMALISGTSQEMTIRDTGAFLAALEAEGVTGPIGTVGYCMGGGRALNAAAAYPGRIVAAASVHGGNLASDAPDSPHRSAARIKARLYVGAAGARAVGSAGRGAARGGSRSPDRELRRHGARLGGTGSHCLQ